MFEASGLCLEFPVLHNVTLTSQTLLFLLPGHDHSTRHISGNEVNPATAIIQKSLAHLHDDHEEHGHVHGVEPEMFIGLSLCCGFVFMLLIDRISGGHSHGSAAATGGFWKLMSSHTAIYTVSNVMTGPGS